MMVESCFEVPAPGKVMLELAKRRAHAFCFALHLDKVSSASTFFVRFEKEPTLDASATLVLPALLTLT